MSELQKGLPRRNIQNYELPAERSLRYSMADIEELGADPKLTEALMLVQKAKEIVSDYIDKNLTEILMKN